MTFNQDLMLCPNQDLTSNQINNLSTRLSKAKEFLQKYPKEQKITAAHIFNLAELILQSMISRAQDIQHSKQNKIL